MTAKSDIKESLVSYAIEKTLSDLDNSVLVEIYHKLHQRYGLDFIDCYNNPVYFRRILLETFGDSHIQIIELVKKRLGRLSTSEEFISFFRVTLSLT